MNYHIIHWYQPIFRLDTGNIVGYEAFCGVKIAIDDMGTGYSSLRHWCDLNPDFVKLDGYYIDDLKKDSRKQRVIKSLLNLFENTADLIAEKIETQDELHVIKDLGVKYAQGYILGKPAPLKCIIKNLKGDCLDKQAQIL